MMNENDTNDDQRINTLDVAAFVPVLNGVAPRYDFTMNGIVNTLDVAKYIPILNDICVP